MVLGWVLTFGGCDLDDLCFDRRRDGNGEINIRLTGRPKKNEPPEGDRREQTENPHGEDPCDRPGAFPHPDNYAAVAGGPLRGFQLSNPYLVAVFRAWLAGTVAGPFFRPMSPRTSVRMKNEQNNTGAERIRVAAPVIDAGIPVCSEVLEALPDPSDPDQAIVVNVPVMVDGLNYGDLVRLAPENEFGFRRIVEVVVASGHQHMLACVQEGEAADLVNELERMFPSWALRVERASGTILSVSVHPHLDPDEVGVVVAGWLAEDSDVDEGLAMTLPQASELGQVVWASSA